MIDGSSFRANRLGAIATCLCAVLAVTGALPMVRPIVAHSAALRAVHFVLTALAGLGIFVLYARALRAVPALTDPELRTRWQRRLRLFTLLAGLAFWLRIPAPDRPGASARAG